MFANTNYSLAGLLIGLLFLPLGIAAQSFEEDIEAIVQKVGASESYTIESTVKVYSKKGGSLQHQLSASVMASKSASLTIMAEMELFSTDSKIIMVDRDERLIEVQELSKPKSAAASKNKKEALKLDELQKLAEGENGLTFKLTNTSGNIRTYSASSPKTGIKSVVIQLDAVEKKLISYAIEQLDTDGSVQQYVVVDYTKFSYTADKPELLKISHFILSGASGYQPSAAFKGYTIVKK